jgi:trans-aconitate methyltransferase
VSKDWQTYWQSRRAPADPSLGDLLVQVSKTRFGAPVDPSQLQKLTDHIASRLPLTRTTRGLDLGCGNGLVTALLAPRLATIVGLDYSEALLETARRAHATPHVSYVQADLRDLSSTPLPEAAFDVAWSVEVLQNLDPASLRDLLSWLVKAMTDDFRFLASGIPDRARIRAFYDTPERWDHHLAKEAAGEEQMGRWWFAEEIVEVAGDVGLTVEIGSLPDDYYTSSYRFDALFRPA